MKLRIFFLVTCFLSPSLFSYPTTWSHELIGPLELTNAIVHQIYPGEANPNIHSGITQTHYLKNFDYRVKKKGDCFQMIVSSWVVQSKIYIRGKNDQSLIKGKPRWQSIQNYQCSSQYNDYFNTWEGTLNHEKYHFKVRDNALKNFWSKFSQELTHTCMVDKQKLEQLMLLKIQKFLLLVNSIDKESIAQNHEYLFYQTQAGCE